MFSGGFDLKTFASGDVDLIKNMSLWVSKLYLICIPFKTRFAAISGHAVTLVIFVVCCCDYRIGIDLSSSKRSKKQHGHSHSNNGNCCKSSR